MRIAVGFLIMILLAGRAWAQVPGMSFPMGEERTLTDDEKEKKANRERDYKAAIGKIPDQKATADPWGNIRGADTQTNKTSKKPAQTGSQ